MEEVYYEDHDAVHDDNNGTNQTGKPLWELY